MTLPLDTARTTSGIVVDPQTLERVVPSSRRSDGTVRKELKVRPGFVPVEDISRFRPSRVIEAGSSRFATPGSPGSPSSSSGRRDPYARDQGVNPFRSQQTPSPSGKARVEGSDGDEIRRVGKGGHDVGMSWDDDGTVQRVEVDEAAEALSGLRLGDKEPGEPLGTGARAPGGGAPKESISATLASTESDAKSIDTPALTDPPTSSSPADPVASPPPAPGAPVGASQLVSPDKTEREWKAAKPPLAAESSPETSSRADRGGRWVRGGAPPPPQTQRRGGPPGPGFRSRTGNGSGFGSDYSSRSGPSPGFESRSAFRSGATESPSSDKASGTRSGFGSGARESPSSNKAFGARSGFGSGPRVSLPSDKVRREININGGATRGPGILAAQVKELVVEQGKENGGGRQTPGGSEREWDSDRRNGK